MSEVKFTHVRTIKQDTSGPHATCGTAINEHKLEGPIVSQEELLEIAKKHFKSGYLVDRKILSYGMPVNHVTVQSTYWYN